MTQGLGWPSIDARHLAAAVTGKELLACTCTCQGTVSYDRGIRPARSTFWGVAQSWEKVSGSSSSAIGRKLKMPPPALLISTTVSGGRISPIAPHSLDGKSFLSSKFLVPSKQCQAPRLSAHC